MRRSTKNSLQIYLSPKKGNNHDPQTILDHWFSPASLPYWFAQNEAFDADIRTRFVDIWMQTNSVTY